MPQLRRPKPQFPPAGRFGRVSRAPAGSGDSLEVIVPDFDQRRPYEIRRWQARGLTIPAAGDEVLVVEDETGEPWVPAWWPAAGDVPIMGGASALVINVEEAPYGAISGRGVLAAVATANRVAIQAAVDAAAEGRIVWFPGVYEVDGPIDFRRLGRYRGPHVPAWNTGGTLTRPRGVIRAHATFAGEAIARVRDKALTGLALDNFGGQIEGLAFDGNNQLGANIDGLLFAGLTDDWTLHNVEAFGCARHGIHAQFNGTYQKLLSGFRVYCRDNGGDGAHFDVATDFNFAQSQMNSNDGNGWWLSGVSSGQLVGTRAEWNGDNGYEITGAINKLSLIGPSTDRNEHHGIWIKDCVSNTPIQIVAPYTRRDGRNGNLGAGGFAGICVEGTVGGPNQPINITGVAQRVGRDDDGTGVYSPQYGVKVDYVVHMNIEGQLWGQAAALSNAGVSTVRVAPNILYITGDPGAQVYSRGVMVEENLDISGGRSLKFDRVALQKTDGNSYIELPEQGSAGSADPGTPAAGKVRMFARDNGSGVTDLRLKYDDGTGQSIQTGGPWQPLDGTLTGLAAQIVLADKIIYATGPDAFAVADFTATARSLLDDTSIGAMRTTLGLGTMATQNAASVAITGGTIAGITDLAVADGGTGSSTAATARTALGLVIGTDVEAHDATLTALAAQSVLVDKIIYATGADAFAVADFTATARSLVDDTSLGAMRTTLGLVIGTNVEAHDATLTGLAGVSIVADTLIYATGVDTFAATTLTSFIRTLLDDADAATARGTLGVISNGYVCLRDEKASGTAGGGTTAATWVKRTVTEFSDTGGDCAVAASVIVLAAGTYRCRISAPVYATGTHKIRLRNTTAGATILVGSSEVMPSGTAVSNRSVIDGRFTVAAGQNLEIQHWTQNTRATDGFGLAVASGEVEVYTVAEFWKE